ncbi:MAG TPA: MFS transporter [Pseudomonas xinjiangensis]|uniref:MFS transporter n=2 Tax=root TaxID=1 RepID=A0A7V1FSP8_9GAMM|nr:MFS transporter [Halopseudomonas xinjiangensis]HEC47287.1 MFS transporter [Halopseudomonas xinjiangensis]
MLIRILALTAATAAVGTQTFVFAGLLIELAAELGVSTATGGYLATAFALAYAITAPFIALRTGHIERRRLLWMALLSLALINLAAAWASSFTELLALRMVAGLAATLVIPVVPSTVALLFPPERRAQVLALVMGGMVLAFLFGMPLGSLVGSVFGWRSTFLVATALCLIAAISVRLALPAVASPDSTEWHLLRLGWQPQVRRLLLMTLTAFGATFCVVPYIARVVERVIGDTHKVALAQMLVGVGALCGVIIASRLGQLPNPGRILMRIFIAIGATQLLYSASMIWLPGQGLLSWIGLGVAVTLGAAALFTLSPLIQAQLVEAAPNGRQVVMALNGSMMFLGQGAGAAIGAQVTHLASLQMLGIAGASVAAVGWICARRLQSAGIPTMVEATD